MRISTAHLTSKGQVTVPAWVRKTLGVEPNMDIVWMEFKPGEISVLGKVTNSKDSIEKLCGILKGKGMDDIDLVQSLLEDRKKDRELEDRPYKS